ncbi:MAG: hypothetical protein HKL90_10150 [Elusimicrobia bacterium]|nr:hypothetical protein [Elusimicrobiota bacterium]
MIALSRRALFCLLVAVPAGAQLRGVDLAASAPVPIEAALGATPLAAPLLATAAAAPLSAALSAPAAPTAALAAPAFSAAAAEATPEKPAAASAAAAVATPTGDDATRARSLNSFWDGFEAPEGVEPVASFAPDVAMGATEDSTLPSFLDLHDRRFAPALSRGLALARSTRVGARALDDAEAALDGGSIPLDVKDLGRNYGEWDYLNGRLRLDRRLFEPGREADLAGTLAHELRHVTQHAQGLPSNALELEIEAHLQDLALLNELGLKSRPHTFSRQLEDALKRGPDAFVALIQAAVPGSPYLGEQSLADIVDQLEQDLDDVAQKTGPRAQKLAAQIESDLERLRSPKGRAAYKAFSARVRAELKRRAA